MPKIPTSTAAVEKTATSVDILNAVRNEMGEGSEYASLVPLAEPTSESIRAIGSVIMQYQPLKNAFLSSLINRIAFVRITSRLYENPWRFFKKGLMEMGETVEEVFVNLAKPHQFDPGVAENEVFKREIPDVRAAFHSMNYQHFYKTTVSNDQLRQAFLSWDGITDLISRIIESLYTGANYDEFQVMKYMIGRAALDGLITPTVIPEVSADNSKSVVSTIKEMVNKFQFMSNKYNYAGVQSYTDPSRLYVIINSAFDAMMDVEVLAAAFNMDKAEFLGRRVLVDSFADLDNTRLQTLFANDPYTNFVPFTSVELAILNTIPVFMCDVDWFMIFDNYYNMAEQYNGEGLYWNYWYHVWKTFSISPFSNATAYTSQTPAITSVTVDPATVTAAGGSQVQLSAVVVGTGIVDKSVVWTLPTGVHSTIDQTGLVRISATELVGNSATDTSRITGGTTNNTITVTATSRFDNTKKGTCVITIS